MAPKMMSKFGKTQKTLWEHNENEHPEMSKMMQREPEENLIKHREFHYFGKMKPAKATPESASGRPPESGLPGEKGEGGLTRDRSG